MNTNKTVFEPYPESENRPLGLQNINNDPNNKSNSKVEIERIIENESFQLHVQTQNSLLTLPRPPK